MARQDPNAAVTWTSDWAKHLALNGNPTITAATVTCPTTGVTISGKTTAATTVTFRLTTANVTAGTITVTISATLSNGDTDVRAHQFTIGPT